MTGENSQVLLTKEGYKKLQDELNHGEGELRKKLQETLNQMRKQGDLRENDGYSIAVEDFQNNEERITTLKETLEKAQVVTKKKSTKVEIGSFVTIECKKGVHTTYIIVGEHEANPVESKISYKSPIGSSLMGKTKGSKIVIDTPSGKTECTIISVR